MQIALLIIVIPAALIVLWSVIATLRYLLSGNYQVDLRLRQVTRR